MSKAAGFWALFPLNGQRSQSEPVSCENVSPDNQSARSHSLTLARAYVGNKLAGAGTIGAGSSVTDNETKPQRMIGSAKAADRHCALPRAKRVSPPKGS